MKGSTTHLPCLVHTHTYIERVLIRNCKKFQDFSGEKEEEEEEELNMQIQIHHSSANQVKCISLLKTKDWKATSKVIKCKLLNDENANENALG